jgi:hypothetical protein
MTLRGTWEVEHSWTKKVQMTLEKDGTIILRRFELDKTHNVKTVEYRGTWYVRPWYPAPSQPDARIFFCKVRNSDGNVIEDAWLLNSITSRNEILMWDSTKVTFKRLK